MHSCPTLPLTTPLYENPMWATNLRAGAVLARSRRERAQTDLWTNPPSIFPSLIVPLSRWRRSLFSPTRRRGTLFQQLSGKHTSSQKEKGHHMKANLLCVLLHSFLVWFCLRLFVLLFLYDAFTDAVSYTWIARGLLPSVDIWIEEGKIE